MNNKVIEKVALDLKISEKQIVSVLTMLEEGSTIPFIARYRKEKTDNLDEVQLRDIAVKYEYEDKLDTRKEEVIKNIFEKGKLTPELEKAIRSAVVLKTVEDLYLPYKEKKKTRATIAISKGLDKLAAWMLEYHDEDVHEEAKKYLKETVLTTEDAIKGAMDIIAEQISDDIIYRNYLTEQVNKNGVIVTNIKKDAHDERNVYSDYYDYSEPVRFIANHRILAINRGEKEGILKVFIALDSDDITMYFRRKIIKKNGCSVNPYIIEAIQDSYTRLLFPSIENEVRSALTERAETKAIELFTINLEQLLLTPPLKNTTMLGVDPAFRTGCKLAVINGNGDFVIKDVIYPHQKYPGEEVPAYRLEQAEKKVAELVNTYKVKLIASGNGTASRETEEFLVNTIKKYKLDAKYIIVSEAGASVYSASELAKKEFPELVVEERSAISIARRVIDPLSELIKIDPKSIGVGQYQHDVNQKALEEGLDFTITKVVNNVGVNVNSASVPLLSYVSGLNKKTSESIVNYRQENGDFKSRSELKKVPGIGPKSYEQAIGFLKILESKNPLDKTFIHPDNYKFVAAFLTDLGFKLEDVGTPEFIDRISNVYLDEITKKYEIGEYSLKDIIDELKRPLRDIRDNYPMPILKSDILHIEDLKPGMQLEGTVRSIVDFGVFVDIGLKNDGMIHKSKLSKNKVNHPLDVVSIGEIINVYVIDVDLDRKRVALSLVNPSELAK